MICDMNCLNCVYQDCINDTEPTEAEMQAQDELDIIVKRGRAKEKGQLAQWNYNHSQAGKESQRRYAKSEKGKEAQRRYLMSDKGRQAQKRYIQSDKGIEAEKRRTQKRIESGKNAEYCRRYYWKKKGIVV